MGLDDIVNDEMEEVEEEETEEVKEDLGVDDREDLKELDERLDMMLDITTRLDEEVESIKNDLNLIKEYLGVEEEDDEEGDDVSDSWEEL